MTMKNLTSHFSTKTTPQTEVIPGRSADMAKNNAGGVSFKLDKWGQLARFLILGSEGGTYYVNEKKLTAENAQVALDCLQEDGLRVVREVVDVSTNGRAPKNTPALFVLALAAKLGDEPTRKAAFEALPKVARIGTHLFQFAEGVKAFGGWGRATQRAFASWYKDRDNAKLAYQLVKYQSRDGWSHADVLRLAKPSGHSRDSEVGRLLGWATGKWSPDTAAAAPGDATDLVWAFEKAKAIGNDGGVSKDGTSAIVNLITDYGLPREAIPTQYLNEVKVWDALLDNQGRGMPITALIRNLPKMTAIGLISQGSDAARKAKARITDAEVLKNGRVHPLQVLVALRVYGRGSGVRGSLSWTPATTIVNALDNAFYKAFGAVESTGKRTMIGLDVSGSMGMGIVGGVGGVLNAREASAAMSMVTAAVEEDPYIVGFTGGGYGYGYGRRASADLLTVLDISPRRRLDDNIRAISNLPFGSTDCSLPMVHAMEKGLKVDHVIIYTDNETYAGSIHPSQALDRYKQATGIDTKLTVVGMTSTGFTIADPKRNDMLDVVGFDVAAPNIISAFARGDF